MTENGVGSGKEKGRLVLHVAAFWAVEDLAEMAVGLIGCGEEASGCCLFAWNFNVTRSTVLTEAERRP
jgi:hypothetical protein